jgi:hypothetical protein
VNIVARDAETLFTLKVGAEVDLSQLWE